MPEGLVGIGVGLYFLLASRWAARFAVRSWHRAFPRAHVSERAYRVVFAGGGIVFIILGLLSLLGVIRDK
jgi:hypothetical protein